MAKFTKTDDNGAFIGWDSLTEESSEATYAEDLFLPMPEADRAIFAAMGRDSRKIVNDSEYFRED